jgi:small multidrug resistance family-3 protein
MDTMTIARSLALFIVAAVAELGGAWLIWQVVREHRAAGFAALGVIALGAYGFVAAFQPDPHFGRVLAAYGGMFVAASLGWAVIVDKFRPDRYDLIGASSCLLGVAIIICAPRSAA